MTIVKCDYCGDPAKLVTGVVIYPHRADLAQKWFWHCAPCRAYVGCHPDGTRPLGRLANAELRRAKTAAHEAFDPIWRASGMRRKEAYRWLAGLLGIDPSDCHIGMFDVQQCRRVVEVIRDSPFGALREEIES